VRYTEVESKYPLPDPDALVRRLAELDAVALGENRQVDTYFSTPDRFGIPGRDSLSSNSVSQWLRLRTESTHDSPVPGGSAGPEAPAGCAFINLKRWSARISPEVTHFEEFESALGNVAAVREILHALGFTELITVDKTRRRWRLGDVIVALDSVLGLGSFAEFEYAGDAIGIAQARHAVAASVRKIDVKLGERDRQGYPRLLLKHQPRIVPLSPAANQGTRLRDQ
jgi:adenylate cyclase class 2